MFIGRALSAKRACSWFAQDGGLVVFGVLYLLEEELKTPVAPTGVDQYYSHHIPLPPTGITARVFVLCVIKIDGCVVEFGAKQT